MRVFVTGATGFIGLAVVGELIGNGHHVLGLCRSADKAHALASAGAEVHSGSTEDLDSLRSAADRCDGVIHLAFNHDFSTFKSNCEHDRHVILALGSALAGSSRPLLVTSGTGIARATSGQHATEDGPTLSAAESPRAASEEAASSAAATGVNVSVVRLPQVHDTRRQGLVSYLIAVAREKGLCAYLGDGLNRWPAAHVLDVARLYRLALEQGQPGARYHAVAEPGIALREMVGVIAQHLKLPIRSVAQPEAEAYFGWMSPFAALDMPASSDWTRRELGWQPTGPGMMEDLQRLDLSGQ